MHGVITKYDYGRKFGFIRVKSEERDDLFFHLSDVIVGAEHLAPGVSVKFVVGKGEKGPKAVEVSVTRVAVSPYKFFTGAAIFLTVAIVILLTQLMPELAALFSYLIAINVAVFCLTGFDKSSSGGSTMRVPERILFAFAAAGGSLGLAIGMRFFRHKTKKPSFQFVVALVLVAQVVLIKLFFPDLSLRRDSLE